MSRIGKQPIKIPKEVEVTVDGNLIHAKGPKGELSVELSRIINIEKSDENTIALSVKNSDNKKSRAIWGLSRALAANIIKGVTEGFEKSLEFTGVGFRAMLKGNDLELNLGFSHPVLVKAPEGISFKIEKNIIKVSGIDKYLVGQTAANVKSKKPVEPYKGKGIKYVGEFVKRKAGKKAAGATA